MDKKDERGNRQRIEEVKELAALLLHKYYCEDDIEGMTSFFAREFLWLGIGENDCLSGRDACIQRFERYKGNIPKCRIWDEEYEAVCPAEGVYVLMGRLWIATEPSSEMFLKLHQRVTFVFQETKEGLKCVHFHCSNPYQEMMDGEGFPEKIGRQSYEYVQERLKALEEETKQQNRQLEVIMSSIAGGLKISNDDEEYSFAFVSKEAAALFGYTVEEFMEATGGTAVGNVYPPDLPRVMKECEEAFRDGGLTYSIRYRARCKDGSLKWIIDSGKKSQDAEGNWLVNSLYLDVTRSEEAAERIREQTELLTSIYDTVPCGIIRFLRCWNGDYRLLSLNKAVLSLMGYSEEEEGKLDWKDGVLGAIMEEDSRGLREVNRRLIHTGDSGENEYRVKWRDGSVHWMEGTTTVIGMTPENETILQRTMVDITQRKILQQRLEQEQEMYRVAMEAGSSVMFEYLLDTDTFISYEPRAGEGVLCKELKNYSQVIVELQIVHPDDVPIVMDNLCRARTEVFEARFVRPGDKPGQYTWYRVDSRLLMRDGRPYRVAGTLHNIHSMKTKLSENSERLEMNQSALQAINGVYVSIFYVDMRKDSYYAVRMPEAGKGATLPRIGNYSMELCQYILDDVDPEDWKRVERICDKDEILERLSGEDEHTEVEFRHKNHVMWLRLEVHLVAMEEGKPKTIIIAIRNISQEKQRELEYREEEKKAKHALEEAYESVNRANQAKSDFLSKMSHDIRTPINAIMGMSAIAEHNLEDEDKIADCLSKINLSGRHLQELVNEVLDMSKIESGKTSLSEEKFRITELLEEVSQIILPDVDSKKQHFSLDIRKLEHDFVCGDATRVKQILINLINNAVKYTGEGGNISIFLEEKLSSESGVGCFEFIVEDNGIGMAEPFLQKLFQPFERAEDARVSHTQGTGLGLSITRNLVQMMNGTIQVESKLDQGSRFIVTIYLKLNMSGEESGDRQVKDASLLMDGFPPDTCILVVEDNQINQEIVEELLSMAGLKVECAGNGREALKKFKQNPPGTYAMILMDIQMPVMNGYDAAKAIRSMAESKERPDAADVPIIALTANAFADDVYKARKAGMNEHVMKPLDIDRLFEVMHRWIPGN